MILIAAHHAETASSGLPKTQQAVDFCYRYGWFFHGNSEEPFISSRT